MDEVKIIQYKGKDIVYIDFSDVKTNYQKAQEINDEVIKVLCTMPPKSALTLTNVTRIRFNPDVVENFQKNVAKSNDYQKAAAIVGVTGLLKIAFKAVTHLTDFKAQLFDSEEEAKEWLIQQDK